MNLSFTKVDLHDSLDDLFYIEKQCFNRPIDLITTKKEQLIGFYEYCDIWLIKDGEGNLVGNIASEKKSGFIEVVGLAILPEYQNKGVGKKALEFVITQNSGTELRLVTHPQNTGAIICYLKSGFVIDSWKENYFGDGKHRLLLIRKA